MKRRSLLLLVVFYQASVYAAGIGSFSPKKEVDKIKVSDEQKKEKGETEAPFATHALFIFLDDSEEEIGAIGDSLLLALEQKVPCLVSTSLLKTIFIDTPSLDSIPTTEKSQQILEFEKYFKDLIGKTRAISIRKITDQTLQQGEIDRLNKSFVNPPIDPYTVLTYRKKGYLLEKLLLKDMVNFNPNDWIIKFVDSTRRLCLLLPKQYKNALNDFDLATHPFDENPDYLRLAPPTEAELAVGLKIDHMIPVVDLRVELGTYNSPNEHPIDYFVPSLWDNEREKRMPNNCSDIFVSNNEYKHAKKPRPRWLIYMDGHGGINLTQVSISLADFRKTLAFYDSRIHTVALAYSTCNAQGTNAQLLYEEETRPEINKTYSFAIAMEGTADSPVGVTYRIPLSNFKRENIDFTEKTATGLIITSDFQCGEFVAKAKENKIDFADLFGLIIRLKYNAQAELLTVPYYRLPGKEQFRIIDPKHHAVELGSAFAKTCTVVDLERYFTKKGSKPRYYFLNTPYIPCELVLNFDPADLPMFIPNAPTQWITNEYRERPLYFINKISSSTLNLDNIIELFIKALLLDDFTVMVAQADLKDGGSLFAKKGNIAIKNLCIVHQSLKGEKKYSVIFEHGGLLYGSSEGNPVRIVPDSFLDFIKDRHADDLLKIEQFKKEAEHVEHMRRKLEPSRREEKKKAEALHTQWQMEHNKRIEAEEKRVKELMDKLKQREQAIQDAHKQT